MFLVNNIDHLEPAWYQTFDINVIDHPEPTYGKNK